ncbi:hypothetical protein ACLGI4_26180 [Streptomyces sp. HMX112]|uniref:hypothetical protein n=1 Tax=Streptomyces sp. HMX112 TaxID=3390850 RepID=UPI003A80B4F1
MRVGADDQAGPTPAEWTAAPGTRRRAHGCAPVRLALWRGALVDVARHFQPGSFLRRFTDLLASTNMDLFPSSGTHVGGDECPTTEWHHSPAALRRVVEEGAGGRRVRPPAVAFGRSAPAVAPAGSPMVGARTSTPRTMVSHHIRR